MKIRRIAADILYEVLTNGRSLTVALEGPKRRLESDQGRGLLQSLCYGTLRWYFRLEQILNTLLHKPLKKKDSRVRIQALIGLYELAFTRAKPYAVVSESVSATHQRWAKSLVNAILRGYLRDRERIDAVADGHSEGRTSHPSWLLDELNSIWGERVEDICAANNTPPPMSLRVNRQKCSRDRYLEMLGAASMQATPIDFTSEGLQLLNPVDVARLPGFHEGLVSVQDGAAQLAAGLLDAKPGHRVLDACAAPGGKTAHILELNSALRELVAVDIDRQRALRIRDNLSRLQLNAKVVVGDLLNSASWWDGQLFDRILVDAPCSATGVIRRHPDIKVLRRPSDLASLTRTQENLIETSWTMLAPGGMLVYSTCSIMAQENHEQIERFIKSRADAKEQRIELDWGTRCSFGRQVLPGTDGMDGFYYACLSRRE